MEFHTPGCANRYSACGMEVLLPVHLSEFHRLCVDRIVLPGDQRCGPDPEWALSDDTECTAGKTLEEMNEVFGDVKQVGPSPAERSPKESHSVDEKI